MLKKENNVGVKSSLVGLSLNFVLVVLKFVVGRIFNSVSIMADAMNNFSDFLSSFIAYFGFKMGEKPADKEHPFGHERYEYVSGFIISMMMIYLGIEVLRNSFSRMFKHTPLVLDKWMVFVMVLSMIIKLFLFFYYHRQNKYLNSDVLVAAAQDSLNDVLINTGILLGFLLSYTLNKSVDAVIGFMIALYIIFSSVFLLRDFINELVGIRPDQGLINGVAKVVSKEVDVYDYHDLMIHEYGDRTYYGSIHIEVDQRLDLLKAHEIADRIEQSVKDKTGVSIVVHLDPIDIVSDEIKRVQKSIKETLKALDERFSFHDLRIVDQLIELDVVLFEENPFTEEEITEKILENLDSMYALKIIFDTVQFKDDI